MRIDRQSDPQMGSFRKDSSATRPFRCAHIGLNDMATRFSLRSLRLLLCGLAGTLSPNRPEPSPQLPHPKPLPRNWVRSEIPLLPFKLGSFRQSSFDTLFPPPLSWIFRDRGAAAMSSRADFRLRFGSPDERGRQFRRNRMREFNSFRLGSQAKSCSLSLVTQAGGALSGLKNACTPGASFLPFRLPCPNL
jgi:hypothetical protein